MKHLLTVAVAILAASGCVSGSAQPLSSAPPPSPVAQASAVPSPVPPFTYSGSNSKVSDPTDIPPGQYRVSWQATDHDQIGGQTVSELFDVYLQGQDKNLVINAVLPQTSSGQALFNSGGGSFIIDVEVSGAADWQLTFTWLASNS